MRVMVIVKATKEAEEQNTPPLTHVAGFISNRKGKIDG